MYGGCRLAKTSWRQSLCTLLDNVTLHLVRGLRGQIGMGKNLTFFFNLFSLGINVSENVKVIEASKSEIFCHNRLK